MSKFYKIMPLLILLLGALSCTNSRFDDDVNLVVYVPEIKDKSINDIYLFVENRIGNIVAERHYMFPFDSESSLTNGVIIINLPSDYYKLTAVANTLSADSSLLLSGTGRAQFLSFSLFDKGSGNFAAPPELRSVIREQVLNTFSCNPLQQDTISLCPSTRYVGIIEYQFPELDSSVASVEITTFGLSSALYMDGKMGSLGNEAVTISGSVASNNINPFVLESYFFPSQPNTTISIVVNMYDAEGVLVDSFSQEVTNATDINGNSVPPLLNSGQRMVVRFDGSSIGGVSIGGWDDVVSGGGVDM